MEQPKTGDGELAWRRYAAELRRALGEANSRANAAAARLEETETELAYARRDLGHAFSARDSARATSNKVRAVLKEIEEQLLAGDFPAALDGLARRRKAIAFAQRRHQS
ncbi:hypothetical protein GCM10009746_14100 [Microbacterium paludicola]